MLTLDVDGTLHSVFSDPAPDERALIFRAPVSLVGARRLECAGAEEYGMSMKGLNRAKKNVLVTTLNPEHRDLFDELLPTRSTEL